MKYRWYAVVVMTMLVCSFAAHAVPPAYTGEFGNPEEPALRPYKWLYLGVKSMWTDTRLGLQRGVEKSPSSMVVEGSKGAVQGSASLATHVGKGLVFSPLPPRKDANSLSYEQAAMLVIENRTAKPEDQTQEAAEKPSEEQCAEPDPAAKYRQPAPSVLPPTGEAAKGKPLVMEETKIEKAQGKYVPLLTSYRSNRKDDGAGNLLKLAR